MNVHSVERHLGREEEIGRVEKGVKGKEGREVPSLRDD